MIFSDFPRSDIDVYQVQDTYDIFFNCYTTKFPFQKNPLILNFSFFPLPAITYPTTVVFRKIMKIYTRVKP